MARREILRQEEQSGNGPTFVCSGDQGVLPDKLGQHQSHITTGLGPSGAINGIGLVFGTTLCGRLDRLAFAAGAALTGLMEPNRVLTAHHNVRDFIKGIEKLGLGPVEVWAIPAEKFDTCDQRNKFQVEWLEGNGAVKAKGYRCLQAERAVVHDDQPGMDISPIITSSV
jgi:hypothetical protein